MERGEPAGSIAAAGIGRPGNGGSLRPEKPSVRVRNYFYLCKKIIDVANRQEG
jgi:hypothetical protein